MDSFSNAGLGDQADPADDRTRLGGVEAHVDRCGLRLRVPHERLAQEKFPRASVRLGGESMAQSVSTPTGWKYLVDKLTDADRLKARAGVPTY